MADIQEKEICGIVMPISSIDGCDEGHWSDVLGIINEAITSIDMTPNLVSNADDVGVIHKRIIHNLYNNPIVVCDVSCKNPNVMFELGMRLAFDKPTIIIKDDKTSYSFDTSSIEHIEYPRDLRFTKINDFKNKLSAKIKSTLELHKKSPDQTTFLKHFGEFTVAKIETKEVSGIEFIMEELQSIKTSINKLENSSSQKYNFSTGGIPIQSPKRRIRIRVKDSLVQDIKFLNFLNNLEIKENIHVKNYLNEGRNYIEIFLTNESNLSESDILESFKPYMATE